MAFFVSMRKSYQIIAVLALLFILPLGSYLYLKRGYNFRLEALNELKPKENIKNHPSFSKLMEKDNIYLLYNADDEVAASWIGPVYDEFSHRSIFNVIGYTSDSVPPTSVSNQYTYIASKYPFAESIALVDTASDIRNYYTYDSTSFKKLVQHIPIVLPRKKEEDIKMKNQ